MYVTRSFLAAIMCESIAITHSYYELIRLSALQRQVLKQTAWDCIDPDVRVRLFGSRTVDTRKGGDIEIMIETQLQDSGQTDRAHSQFLARVKPALGEQKFNVQINKLDRQYMRS